MDIKLSTVRLYTEFQSLIVKYDTARPCALRVPNFKQLKEINKIRKRICHIFNEIKLRFPNLKK